MIRPFPALRFALRTSPSVRPLAVWLGITWGNLQGIVTVAYLPLAVAKDATAFSTFSFVGNAMARSIG